MISFIKNIIYFWILFLQFLPAYSEVLPQHHAPEFPLFNLSSWKPSTKLDFIDEGIAPPDANSNSSTRPDEFLANEASREFKSEVWIVVVLCMLLCLAMRHANDFYSGEATTLVPEGYSLGRFKHRGVEEKKKYESRVERDFKQMEKKILKGEAEAKTRRLMKNRVSTDTEILAEI
ncbi:unnamed protein product, partial [Mesorhabditis belari]|uniref:Transmembrane protein n=1 Tax=Mesorhabditis belari TaxID=2138241 RepID=A0AAF3JB17_9BILA